MIAEQAADAERPHDRPLPERLQGAAAGAHETKPIVPPMANVMAASWSGGTAPVAAVKSASSDQSATAPKPTRVALRCVIVTKNPLPRAGEGRVRAARPSPGPLRGLDLSRERER